MKKNKKEFSKIILSLVMITYFIALGFGMLIVYKMMSESGSSVASALCGLFSFVGAPVAVAIGFYSYKAKAENIEKIKKQNPQPPVMVIEGEYENMDGLQ